MFVFVQYVCLNCLLIFINLFYHFKVTDAIM